MNGTHNPKDLERLFRLSRQLVIITLLMIAVFAFLALESNYHFFRNTAAVKSDSLKTAKPASWEAPAEEGIASDANAELLNYGKDLVAHTAKYFGPQGTLAKITNGMNCQNCHLNSGAKPFGNNYALVASTYPKFRARSGSVESVAKRINDCFERSLNGKALDTTSREMKAMVAWVKWVGSNVQKGQKPEGAGLSDIAFLDRAADPAAGSKVYDLKCAVCHGKKGEGVIAACNAEYTYPPLWGEHSYNSGAGLYRISRFASYVASNMPLGSSHENPGITPEEAWDVAAFVNSQARPSKDLSGDWPDISKKPVDHPFGPYADAFSEEQHKYGPFKPIQEFYKKDKVK